jgi:hypothetical protein
VFPMSLVLSLPYALLLSTRVEIGMNGSPGSVHKLFMPVHGGSYHHVSLLSPKHVGSKDAARCVALNPPN